MTSKRSNLIISPARPCVADRRSVEKPKSLLRGARPCTSLSLSLIHIYNEEGEFGAIRTMLDTLHLTAQSASVSAALRQGAGAGNFEADLEYLRALQETLERTHGEQH